MTDQPTPIFRCGLVGCGGVSRSHVRFYPALSQATLVACADPVPQARQRILDLLPDCRGYDNYPALLAGEQLDLAVVATRACLHHPIVLAAARAGVRAILCEKPIALDLGQAREMIEVCAERGVRLVVGHQRRYDPQYIAARNVIGAGTIGDPLAVEAYWPCTAQSYLGGHARAVDGGGFLMYLGVHIFDMLHFCLGRTRRVSARLGRKDPGRDIEDSAVCHLVVEPGVQATVHLGECLYDVVELPGTAGWLRFVVTGTRGALAFGDYSLSAFLLEAGSSDWRELAPSDGERAGTGFQRLHEAIFEALETGAPTRCDAAEAVHAHEVAMAAYQSALAGVPLNPGDAPLDSPLVALGRQRPGRWTVL